MSASAVEVGPAGLDRREASTTAESFVSWGGAIALLVLAVWLVPIKNYRLPLDLPFSLEVYRLLILVYIVAWLLGVVSGTLRLDAGGLGKPIALLVAVGVLSIFANINSI